MPVAFFDEHDIKTCIMKDNFTYISDVEFWNKTTFKNDSYVSFEKDATFDDYVTFKDDVTFEDDVYIANDHKDTYFEVSDKVKVTFEPDYTINIKKDTTFSKDVKMKRDLSIDGDLQVDGHTYLDGTTVDGDLRVKDDLTVDGEIFAKHCITSEGEIVIKYGKLLVQRDGMHVYGHSTFFNDVLVKEDLTVEGAKTYAGDVTVEGLLTVKDGAIIYNGAEINKTGPPARRAARELVAGDGALQVNGKAIIVGGMEITGAAGTDPALDVTGNGVFTGTVVANGLNTLPPATANTVTSEAVVDALASYEGTVTIVDLQVQSRCRVGEDEVLTTADAATVEGDTATTTESGGCGCTGQEILDAINGESVTLNQVSANAYRIWDDVDETYVPFGGGGTCTCTSEEVQTALEGTTLGCGCNENDISGMGFITECPCP